MNPKRASCFEHGAMHARCCGSSGPRAPRALASGPRLDGASFRGKGEPPSSAGVSADRIGDRVLTFNPSTPPSAEQESGDRHLGDRPIVRQVAENEHEASNALLPSRSPAGTSGAQQPLVEGVRAHRDADAFVRRQFPSRLWTQCQPTTRATVDAGGSSLGPVLI
jgi:hypothetical protein